MTFRKCLNDKKELYEILLQYIEDQSDDEYNYQKLIDEIVNQKIIENHDEIESFLRLIIQISNNHSRLPNFFNKIEKILEYFFEFMQTFTNFDLFELFKSNKSIILFLIEHKIITIDKKIKNEMILRSSKTNSKYHHFFYIEIKEFLEKEELEDIQQEFRKEDKNILENFDIKRRTGENNEYLCELIRNDLIEEFVTYVNKTNLSLFNTVINPSIFETNNFLIKNRPTLIEYAAFYGSIQIFQYLKFNNVEMIPSLWLYVIHSQNSEIILLLEENEIQPPNDNYESCLNESIKCHHNDFAKYFQDKYLLDTNELYYKFIFKYCNYQMISDEIRDNSFFYFMCHYNHSELVKLYIKTKQNEVIEKLILILQFEIKLKFKKVFFDVSTSKFFLSNF